MRRRCVPVRLLGEKVIVARPGDGAPVVLTPPAVHVWDMLEDWVSEDVIDADLARRFPDVATEVRQRVQGEILAALAKDGLVERS